MGARSVRPRQSSSSSSNERALLVLSGLGGTSAWLDERLRGGPEVWGGGGRIGMPEVGGAGAGANTGDELQGVSNSARSMRVPWLLQRSFPSESGMAEVVTSPLTICPSIIVL